MVQRKNLAQALKFASVEYCQTKVALNIYSHRIALANSLC